MIYEATVRLEDKKVHVLNRKLHLPQLLSNIGGLGKALHYIFYILTLLTSRVLLMNDIIGELFLAKRKH